MQSRGRGGTVANWGIRYFRNNTAKGGQEAHAEEGGWGGTTTT